MKKIIISVTILLTVAACGGTRSSEVAKNCNRALIAGQGFKGARIGDVQPGLKSNSVFRSVPIIYGQSAIANKTARPGTLVLEVNRTLDTPQEELIGERIINMYCYN